MILIVRRLIAITALILSGEQERRNTKEIWQASEGTSPPKGHYFPNGLSKQGWFGSHLYGRHRTRRKEHCIKKRRKDRQSLRCEPRRPVQILKPILYW